ncbi:MAG: FoF1 ATP synthase subunit gamma [Dongiaceae bacterium]
MTRLAEIQAHLRSMGELRDIIGAMRSLAGMRMQEAARALPGIRRYTDSIASGIADAMMLTSQPQIDSGSGPRALVLFTAEHGFVGGYNERLIEAALASILPTDLLFVLGSRGMVTMAEQAHEVAWAHPLATRTAAAADVAQTLSRELYARIARGRIARVDVIYARYVQGSRAAIEQRRVLPLDPSLVKGAKRSQPPLHNLPPEDLQEKLIAEHVFANLTAAVVESIASENAARLAAMESAHENISKRLDTLHRDAGLARQSEITTEILELVTAAKAIESDALRRA